MNMDNIIALGAACIIEPVEVTTTSLGLELATSGQQTPTLGVIKSVGEASMFKVGDKVFFKRYSVDELKFPTDDGEKSLFIVEDEDIKAKWVEPLPTQPAQTNAIKEEPNLS